MNSGGRGAPTSSNQGGAYGAGTVVMPKRKLQICLQQETFTVASVWHRRRHTDIYVYDSLTLSIKVYVYTPTLPASSMGSSHTHFPSH